VDLRSRPAVHELIPQVGPSVVINCAAYGGYPCQQEPDRIYDVNFNSVRYLLEAVRTLPRFVAFIQAFVSKVAATAVTKFFG
jgi:dTDP-4-dehydrorhamnose reductase